MFEAALLVVGVIGVISYTMYQERKVLRKFQKVVDEFNLTLSGKLEAEWLDDELGLVSLRIGRGYKGAGYTFNLETERLDISNEVRLSVHGRTGVYAGFIQPGTNPVTINPQFDSNFRVYSVASGQVLQAMLPDDLQEFLLNRGPEIKELAVQVNHSDENMIWLYGNFEDCLSNFGDCQEIIRRFGHLAKSL